MNKKASAYETIVNLFRLLFVIVVFFSIYSLVRVFIIQKIDIFEVESNLLTHRLAMSSDINYYDKDIDRVYIGVIDLQKFTSNDFEKNILNSIYYGKLNTEASAKIALTDLEDNKVYEKFYNEELYKEKKVLVEAKLIGSGAARRLDSDFIVLINDNGKLKRGVLKIEAILPNR